MYIPGESLDPYFFSFRQQFERLLAANLFIYRMAFSAGSARGHVRLARL